MATAFIWRVMPFDNSFLNKMELFNEFCVAINSFFLLTYSDLVLEPHSNPLYKEVKISGKKIQSEAGWHNAALLVYIVVFNIGIITIQTIRNSITNCNRRYCQTVQAAPKQKERQIKPKKIALNKKAPRAIPNLLE